MIVGKQYDGGDGPYICHSHSADGSICMIMVKTLQAFSIKTSKGWKELPAPIEEGLEIIEYVDVEEIIPLEIDDEEIPLETPPIEEGEESTTPPDEFGLFLYDLKKWVVGCAVKGAACRETRCDIVL